MAEIIPADSGPPGLDKMFLISIWIETVIYGINFVFFCVMLSTFKDKFAQSLAERRPAYRWLFMASVLSFLIATAHIALALRQLIVGFITPSIVQSPGGASWYFSMQPDNVALTMQILYVINVLIQDPILIWRSWVVWGYDWKIALGPLLLELVHVAASWIAVANWYHAVAPNSPEVKGWAICAWCLELVINVSLTGAICGRILWIGNTTITHRLHGGNVYLGTVYVMLESGALSATATFIATVLYFQPDVAPAIVATNVVTQVATLSPLLILVRVGLRLTGGSPMSYNVDFNFNDSTPVSTIHRTGPADIPIQVNIVHVHSEERVTTEVTESGLAKNSYEIQV